MVKVCRQEANEIDTCAECYLNANSSDEWFVKVCTHPHLLLWAKLKGFPYWPAKAMGAGPNAVVNVRFFGKHDRANVPVKDCFLYCAQDPNTQTSRRSARDLAECIREVEVHIEHIKEKIGSFHYAPYRTPYDPLKEQQQLEEMMPGVHDVINRQLEPANKTPLQFLIRKTAGDKLSIVKKTKATESGNESDQSSSPAKKSLQNSPTTSQAPPPTTVAVSDPPKVKSSNYEVIPRAGDALRESRGCTVVLKRKSLETSKTSKTMLQLAVKRKHSQSDASSEASSYLGTSETGTEHRRRAKHSRKQLQDTEADAHSEQETEAPPATESLNTEANPAVVSVVELVRRRQGVTITKIPREQQQQQTVPPQVAAPVTSVLPVPTPVAAAIATPAPSEPILDEMLARQRAVERQQQQLISKVVPFVEIKREVLSEPEEGEEILPPPQSSVQEQEQHQPQPQLEVETTTAKVAPANPIPVSAPAAAVSVPAPVVLPAPAPPPPPPVLHPPGTVPPPVIVPLKIKEEVVSEEEMETDSQPPVVAAAKPLQEEATPSATPPMPPPATPAVAASPAAVALPQQNEDFVRFVGDTTIQRLIHKQSPKLAETPTNKRNSIRGVPHGPLPAAALSPPPASSSPAPSASPKPANNSNRSTAAQPQKSPVPQQVRVKTDKSLNVVATSPPPNLLKTNMVVIPMDTRNSTGGAGNGGVTGGGIGTLGVGGANLNNSNLMTIPVPPLRAVSKNTLQAGAMISVPLPIPTPPPGTAAFGNSSVPPPPLAGLTSRSQPTTSTAVTEPAPGHLLANALNGLPSDTLVTESPSVCSVEPIVTTGVATALSELVLRSGPPKLTARPCGPLQSDGGSIYPAQAGPLSTRLKENAHKVSTRYRL